MKQVTMALILCLRLPIVTLWVISMTHDLSAQPPLRAARVVAEPRVLVIAHRGASADFPENTIPAFCAACDAGADLIELDYYHSQDGVPVVFHDETLDRTTDACQRLGREKVAVQSLELSQLKGLDAGSWFGPQFAGTQIPTLQEALCAIQGKSITLIERKHGDAVTCVRLLHRLKLVDQVVVQSFDWQYIKECHEQEPRLVLAALGDKELSFARIAEAAACGARMVGWKAEDLDAAAIERAHQKGLRVWAYTVNDSPEAERLMQGGVDGLITDRPKSMRSIVRHPSAETAE